MNKNRLLTLVGEILKELGGECTATEHQTTGPVANVEVATPFAPLRGATGCCAQAQPFEADELEDEADESNPSQDELRRKLIDEMRRGYREDQYEFRSTESLAHALNADITAVRDVLRYDGVFRRNRRAKETWTLANGF